MARPNLPEEERQELKDKFVKYFQDVPVQKYAAMYIGVTENTITNWLKEDEEFCDAVNQARAEWVKKQVIKAKAEFKLERMEAEIFKERKEQDVKITEVTPLVDIAKLKKED